ncbi:unannotated protein [freshwater metagenome]|uniref:Unannotated protein n=1 Tax=freshwater metagenome TaxID=449393 RepID=A0A6J6F571_9ZZZZ
MTTPTVFFPPERRTASSTIRCATDFPSDVECWTGAESGFEVAARTKTVASDSSAAMKAGSSGPKPRYGLTVTAWDLSGP